MNNVILSAEYPQFADKLKERGFHIINSESLPTAIPYERNHADMQCLILDKTAFVLKECSRLADELRAFYRVILTEDDFSGKYPANVRLNAAVVGKTVIAKTDSLDKNVLKYALDHGYQLIHVNQGYTKCACAVVSDHALITADNGIYNSLKEAKIEVLMIKQGRVKLDTDVCGFIGGATGLHVANSKRYLYCSGNIRTHPDHKAIEAFCERHNTDLVSLNDEELIDIGGMLFC